MTPLAPNSEVIRQTWRWLAHQAHGVSEVRIIHPDRERGIVGIGFFDDEEAFVRECMAKNAAGNVYVGINPRPRRMLALAPNTIRPLKSGAARKDIEVLTATVIDMDPARPKDTGSTDEELERAMAAARATIEWCGAEGIESPRLMLSGNGAQLWFGLPPTAFGDEREVLAEGLKSFEAEIRAKFGSDTVKVDSIHDVARIIKVIGTVSIKGDGQGDRPHRVSAPIEGFERVEDGKLLERLRQPAPDLPLALPTEASASASPSLAAPGTAKANRTPEGEIDWEHPVEMCPPIQRLWNEGLEDRSVAIFDMVMHFAHKGLAFDEIADLVTEYDRRGLGKLKNRDAKSYIRQAHEKALAAVRTDGSIPPPCHSMQKLGWCRVNVESGTRCELYDLIFDIEKAIQAIPADLSAKDLEYRIKPVLDAIGFRSPAVQEKYVEQVATRFGLRTKELRKAVQKASAPTKKNEKASDVIEGEIFEDTSNYYTVTGRGDARTISSFTITPRMRVIVEDDEILLGDAQTDKGTTVSGLRFPVCAFHGRKDLLKHLRSMDLQWAGNDNNVIGLQRLLARRPVPQRIGSHMLGEFRQGDIHVWLGPDCVIGKSGFLESPPAVYVDNGSSLPGRVSYRPASDEAFQKIAGTVFQNLPRVNLPEVILPIIGWFFATPMKPRIMESVGSFPLLCVWGPPGSGKSSICTDVMWPLFGVRDTNAYPVVATRFVQEKLFGSSRSVPIFLDEYKPFDMHEKDRGTLHRLLRRLYRGEAEERGRSDLTVIGSPIHAPVCIAGETRPTEAALLERMITASPEKMTIEENPICREAFRELRAVDLTLFAPRYIQFCLGRDLAADLQMATGIAQVLLEGKKVPSRIVNNIVAMLLGLHLFEEFAHACGCELTEELDVKKAIEAILADLVETEHGVKNALDGFLEKLGAMAVQRILTYRVHYVFDEGKLALHLPSAYDAFRTHCRRNGHEGEIVDLNALRRLISANHKQRGFVLATSEMVCFDGRTNRRRAVLIDLNKTANIVGPEDFPVPDDPNRHITTENAARFGERDELPM